MSSLSAAERDHVATAARPSGRLTGSAVILVAASLWGTTGTVRTFVPEASNVSIAAVRMVIGGLLLVAFAAFTGRGGGLRPLLGSGRDRLLVAAGRVRESEDDELAYAYYAANENTAPYDRRRFSRAYARRAFALYRRHHVERGVAMIFKAVGLTPHSRLNLWAARLAWWGMRRRTRQLARDAA